MFDGGVGVHHKQRAVQAVPMSVEVESPFLALTRDAYAKAERARCRWQAARLTGEPRAAERARRLMLRHMAIAHFLDRNWGARHGPA